MGEVSEPGLDLVAISVFDAAHRVEHTTELFSCGLFVTGPLLFGVAVVAIESPPRHVLALQRAELSGDDRPGKYQDNHRPEQQ